MDDMARRKRSLLATLAVLFAVLCAVVVAGAGAPVASKGKRKKLGRAHAATASSPAAPSASAGPAKPVVAASASAAPAPSVVPVVAAVAPEKPVEKLAITKGTRVLVFGDSMVDAGFAQRLAKHVEARGGVLAHDSWTSSTATSWNKGARLENLVAQHKPDVVLVVLGANEVFLPSPEVIAPRIRSIVSRLEGRPCVWVGPPLWKGETGIVAVQKANAAPCGYFDSGLVKVERAKDGIHPTPKGGADWADAVWSTVVKDE